MYPSVCNNAVWALGEVFVRCVGNPVVLQPYAPEIVQKLLSLILGAAYEEGPIAGLVENASTAMGRLAKANPSFMAGDLSRFLIGWTDGCSKISDDSERRDAFEGLLLAIEANPQSIQQASKDLSDTITSILFAVVSWHIPYGNLSPSLLNGTYAFKDFPPQHTDLYKKMGMFLHQLKEMVGNEAWSSVENHVPVNVRRLMREKYHL